MVGVREEPELDMKVLRREVVIAFAHLVPAALLDAFGKVEGGHDGGLDFGRDAEHAERQALRLEQVGVGAGIAPARFAVGADQAETARHRRPRPRCRGCRSPSRPRATAD